MASGPISALGSPLLGRPVADRSRSARCGLSVQLDSVPAALARWPDPAFVRELVFRPHPLHGGPVLLLALPRPEAESRGFGDRRRRVRIERLLRRHHVAPNAEWSSLGSARLSVLPACHARR